MANRYATGLTVASFPSTAALLAVAAGNYYLAVLLGLLFVLALVLTAAPKIKYLHRLPVFGAVRLAVDFRANGAAGVEAEGREEVVLAVPRGSLPSTVLVEMAVRNLTSREVENVLFGLGCDVGHGMLACDGWGRPVMQGHPIPPGGGFDRWAMTDRHLTAREEPLFHLRMRIREVGKYRAYINLGSPAFYGRMGALLEFEVVETDTPSFRDQLTPIIDRVEAISKEGLTAFEGEASLRQALVDVTHEAHRLLRRIDSQEFIDWFTNAEPDYSGVGTSDEYLRASATARAKVLYEIRSELGRQEAMLPH